jgi:hypothetical protein
MPLRISYPGIVKATVGRVHRTDNTRCARVKRSGVESIRVIAPEHDLGGDGMAGLHPKVYELVGDTRRCEAESDACCLDLDVFNQPVARGAERLRESKACIEGKAASYVVAKEIDLHLADMCHRSSAA